MKKPRLWRVLSERVMSLASRFPRATLITGIVCVVIAFLPYYSHTASDGPSEIDLPFFGKVKGPPERTYFHIGLPWSPWVRYWRVLEYQGPLAFNYSWGYNYEFLCGSTVPAVLGLVLLVVAWRARRARAPECSGTTNPGGEASRATNKETA